MYREEVVLLAQTVLIVTAIAAWDFFHGHYLLREIDDLYPIAFILALFCLAVPLWYYWGRKVFYRKYPKLAVKTNKHSNGLQ